MIIRYGIVGVLLLFFGIFVCGGAQGQDKLGRINCICIDAGHGGKDPGCVGTRSYEKNITLSVALKVGRLIKEQFPDVKVVYTRDKDVFVELNERGKIANSHKADLFISIHVNAIDNKRVRGIETYVLGLHKSEANLKVAMKENAAIRYEKDYTIKYAGFDPNKAESYIIFSMMQNLYLGMSLNIAGMVQEELIKNTHKTDRSVRQAGYLVLKDVAMPAILIELGFLSNPEEERFLISREGQNKMAASIARAFGRYKKDVEKNSRVLVNHPSEKKETPPSTGKKETQNFFYAVQIASAAGKVKDLKQFNCPGDIKELKAGNRYRYYVGETANYEVVKENLQKTRRKIQDCFIIAVYNGKLINIAEAKEIEKKLK